jgi:hypothetical protein|eukprot:6244942-Prymnesium_polylepis.1
MDRRFHVGRPQLQLTYKLLALSLVCFWREDDRIPNAGIEAQLPWCWPNVCFGPQPHPDKQEGQLDPRAEQAPELYHPVALSQSAEHQSLKSDLLSGVAHTDSQECCMRLSCNAMDYFSKFGVHAVAIDYVGRRLDLVGRWQRQRSADCAKAWAVR